ncbi:MAG TPA: hypothetical protein VKI64_08965 [Acidimicrobiales bacterium]|nr:hypothetical protein [Acidimicrobiales bacterium]
MSTAIEGGGRVGEAEPRPEAKLHRRRRSPLVNVRRLSDVSLGDIRRGLARAGPFIGAAGAALLLVAVPPRGQGSGLATAAGGHGRFQLPSNGPAESQAAGGPGGAAPAAAASPPPAPIVASSPVAAPPASATPPAPTSGAAAASPAAPDATDTASAATTGPTDTSAAPTPLSVTAKGWASREAGTPLAADDVPDGTLPVANRVGQADKASFVRLSGTDTTLTLVEDPSGNRSLAGAGAVQACRITAPWTPADAMSFDQAPAYDSTTCVAGTHPDASTWSFDLTSFADRAGGNGFALVPAPSAPVDFQVTFKVR